MQKGNSILLPKKKKKKKKKTTLKQKVFILQVWDSPFHFTENP